MINITILTAMHGRPLIGEIFASHCKSIQSLAPDWCRLEIFAAISDEENKAVCERHGIDYVMTDNLPLGRKWNTGLDWALSTFRKTDYVLILGSDDLISTRIFGADFRKAMEDKVDYFGVQKVYFYDIETDKARMFEYINSRLIGAGRFVSIRAIKTAGMLVTVRFKTSYDLPDFKVNAGDYRFISKDAAIYYQTLRICQQYGGPRVMLWDDDINVYLDGSSEMRLVRAGFLPVAIPTEFPIVVDLKTSDNLHSFNEIARFGDEVDTAKCLEFLSPEIRDAIHSLSIKV